MGCGASKLSDSPASAHGALITLTPDKWVKQLGLPLDASTATLGWCKELGATTMGDLALVGDLMLTRVASELAPIPQAKLTTALSELAAAIHEDDGTWPAWGVEGKVELEPLPEREATGKEPRAATGGGTAVPATDFAAPQGEEKAEEDRGHGRPPAAAAASEPWTISEHSNCSCRRAACLCQNAAETCGAARP